MYILIVTAKLSDVDRQAWLADVFARIAELPDIRVHELQRWNWRAARHRTLAARIGRLSPHAPSSNLPAVSDLPSRGLHRMVIAEVALLSESIGQLFVLRRAPRWLVSGPRRRADVSECGSA